MLREQSNLSAFQILGVWGGMYHTDASVYGILKYYLKSKVLVPYTCSMPQGHKELYT